MKIMIAGLGSVGRRHLRNLRTLGIEDVLLYRTGRSTLPEEELSHLPVETNLEAALAQRPEAVVVANPTSLHLDVAIPAADAGCHLLIEKPLSDTLERIGELSSALRRGGGRALVGFQYRFHPSLEKARRLLEDGAIGRPAYARAHYGDFLPAWHPWEDYRQAYSARAGLGGGVILTLCHPLDYLRWLLGEVEGVSAWEGTLGDLGIEVKDTAEIGLRFASGALGSVHLNYLQRPAKHSLEIVGTLGTLRWDQAQGALLMHEAQGKDWQSLPLPAGFDRNDMFLAEMRHFLRVIEGQAEPACTLEDGVAALRLCLTARQSAAQRAFVAVPPDELTRG